MCSLRDSCTLSKLLSCVHVSLLCVQHLPEDRPTMLFVILMLGDEFPLSQPKTPGFSSGTYSSEVDSSSCKNLTSRTLEEREGRSKVEESTSEYSPVKIFAQTFGVFTEITNLVCAATPPHGSTTEGAPQLLGFAVEAVELLHGPVVEASTPLRSDTVVTLLPYHHTLGLANGSDALHHHIAAHSQLGTITNFGPILEQLHSFPHLPPPLMYAPSYASNKTLARVQLGSTHII
ncbi:unnamed protein product [Prunus armeniaca]